MSRKTTPAIAQRHPLDEWSDDEDSVDGPESGLRTRPNRKMRPIPSIKLNEGPQIRTVQVLVKEVIHYGSLAIIRAAHGPAYFVKRNPIFESVVKTLLEPASWVELKYTMAGMYAVVLDIAGRKIT